MLEQASGECWNPSLQVICSLAKAVLLPLLSRVRCATPHSRVWAGRKDSLIPVFPLFSLGLTEGPCIPSFPSYAEDQKASPHVCFPGFVSEYVMKVEVWLSWYDLYRFGSFKIHFPTVGKFIPAFADLKQWKAYSKIYNTTWVVL